MDAARPQESPQEAPQDAHSRKLTEVEGPYLQRKEHDVAFVGYQLSGD
jgi:hypothetical protein